MASLCRVLPATGPRLSDGLCKSLEAGLCHNGFAKLKIPKS